MEQLSNELVAKLQGIQQKLAAGVPLSPEDTQALLIHLLAQEEK